MKGDKSFTGNTRVGNLSATTVDLNGNLSVIGATSLRNTNVTGAIEIVGDGKITNLNATNAINASTLSATTTNAGNLTAGITKLGATTATSINNINIAPANVPRTLTVSGNANVSGTNRGDQTVQLIGGDVTSSVRASGTNMSINAVIGVGKVTNAHLQTITAAGKVANSLKCWKSICTILNSCSP